MHAPVAPSWVEPYVGLPYRAGGRGPDEYDCWGLVLLVWRERFGMDLPTYEGVTWKAGRTDGLVGETITHATSTLWDAVEPGDEQPGDALVLRMRGHPLHVAMVVEPGLMLHCHDRADACVEPYRCLQWRSRIHGFFRYRHA